MGRADHWDQVYATRAPDQVSWFEAEPATSMAFVRRAIEGGARSVIDVGGGASRLVDLLLDEQLERVAVLDVSSRALAAASERLGARAGGVHRIVGDAKELEDVGSFEIWHDRAVFHFLVAEDDRWAIPEVDGAHGPHWRLRDPCYLRA